MSSELIALIAGSVSVIAILILILRLTYLYGFYYGRETCSLEMSTSFEESTKELICSLHNEIGWLRLNMTKRGVEVLKLMETRLEKDHYTVKPLINYELKYEHNGKGFTIIADSFVDNLEQHPELWQQELGIMPDDAQYWTVKKVDQQ